MNNEFDEAIEIVIEAEMEGIYLEDLQRRLKSFYKERIKYENTEDMPSQIRERLEQKKKDNEAHIRVYERKLSPEIVSRAKRDAGILDISNNSDHSRKQPDCER